MSIKGYQNFDTPEGTLVAGNDRVYLNDVIFAQDIAGKDVLDIGSSQGYFCVEAMKRGARRAVGIEPLHECVTAARDVASQLGVAPEYIETDFESWESADQFDTVLCLNVLHHMYDPIHVLRKMVAMTRDTIVIEFSPPRWRDVWQKRIGLMSFLAQYEPLLIMGRPRHPKDSVRVAEYTFMITPAALRTFFNVHYSCFGRLEIRRSPFKGRMIAIAQKRKIKTLTIVAGPTSSGKSTFIEKLTASSELRRTLGIPDQIDMVASYKLYQSPIGAPLEHVVMHYDILRPHRRAIRTHARDPVLSIVSSAQHVNVLNIHSSPERLVEQITKGEPASSPRHQEIKRLYSDPSFLRRWYGDWQAFVNTIPHARVCTIENNGEFTVATPESVASGTEKDW